MITIVQIADSLNILLGKHRDTAKRVRLLFAVSLQTLKGAPSKSPFRRLNEPHWRHIALFANFFAAKIALEIN